VDIIKSAGERLHEEGFTETKFIVPAEETVTKSIDTSRSILADKAARSYIGALAYHAYPYDSAYSSVRRILQASGTGQPDHDEIRNRRRIYELAAQHELPVWMTETSEGPGRADYPFGSPENLRARANHIHDELVYANTSAYFAMYNLWDRQSHDAHFKDRGIDFFSESSHIALVDQTTSDIHISGIGFAIGHFSRWITPGSLRIDAVSDNKLVKVAAFRSDRQNELTLVVINNSNFEAEMDFSLENMALQGTVEGEYSDRSNRWKQLPTLTLSDNASFRLTVGPTSVTSLSATLINPD
jgi:O-glycosyl hydrolase